MNEKLRQDSIKKTPKVVVQKRFKDEQLLGVTNYTDYSIIQSMYTPKLQAVGEALVNKCQDNESKLLRPDSQLSVQRTKHGHRTCKISSHINPENHAHADISSLTNLFPEGKPTATQQSPFVSKTNYHGKLIVLSSDEFEAPQGSARHLRSKLRSRPRPVEGKPGTDQPPPSH